ncbi:conserved hypothetical protein [Burkholderiales bacterium 8X]|nr:conserved hypothetical protein [Burkholderiales bacterium 8X]
MRCSTLHCARLARIIGVLMLCSMLGACSAIKLAYNNLPEVTYWWLDGYVDFGQQQSPRVRADLDTLLAWHRRQELPKIVDLLQEAQAKALEDIAPEQACQLADKVRERLVAVAAEVALPAAELAATLDETQLYNIERKYAKINAGYRQDWLDLSLAQQREKRFKLYLGRYEDFYGRLDSSQRTLVRTAVERSRFDARAIDADRRQRQAETLALLQRIKRENLPIPAARAELGAYLLRAVDPPPGATRDRQRLLLQEGCRDLAELHNQTNPEQRKRAARRLGSYATDFKDLAEVH